MSRKHFRALAAIIALIKNMDDRRTVAYAIAVICAESNQGFKHGTFYKACGL